MASLISWSAPAAITYGTPLSGTQLNASANTAGGFVYNPPAGTVLGGGVHTLNVTFTPTDTINYAGATAAVSLTVNPAAQTIGFGLAPTLTVAPATVPVPLLAPWMLWGLGVGLLGLGARGLRRLQHA